jgi:MFS family permease
VLLRALTDEEKTLGGLSDIYGKKRISLIIMIIYAIGVSIAGFATNIYFLVFAGAIQGIGMAIFQLHLVL